jgi:hypothetical protein
MDETGGEVEIGFGGDSVNPIPFIPPFLCISPNGLELFPRRQKQKNRIQFH